MDWSKPRAWYAGIDSDLIKLGFIRSNAEPNLYFKTIQGMPLILVLYFDDLFMTGATSLILECKRKLASEFEMKDLGLMHYFLGLEVWQKPSEIFLSQGKYVVKLLERFGMVECKSLPAPMEINFKRSPGEAIGPYLAIPSQYRQLVDWAGNVVDKRSTSGCCFSLGFAMISWMNRKQKSIALSTAEAEYIVVSLTSCEAVWLRKLFGELFEQVLDTTIIYCDNKSGIRLSENPFLHKSKHIEIKYHFIQDMVQRRVVRLLHISIDEQIADILTKALPKGKFLVFREKLRLVEMTLSNKGLG
eukprot:PITA_06084